MLFIPIILTLIPVVNFGLQYYFCYKSGTLNQYRPHFTTYWGDLIFIPFNLIFLFAVSITWGLFLPILFLSILGNIIEHYISVKVYSKPGSKFHMVSVKDKRLTPAGFVHFFFSTFQTTLVVLAIVSVPIFPAYYILYLFALGFCFILLIGSKMFHGDVIVVDLIISMGLFLAFTFAALAQ